MREGRSRPSNVTQFRHVHSTVPHDLTDGNVPGMLEGPIGYVLRANLRNWPFSFPARLRLAPPSRPQRPACQRMRPAPPRRVRSVRPPAARLRWDPAYRDLLALE